MNILKFHSQLIKNYKSYIQSFLHIKDEKIRNFVDKEIHNNKLLPEPLVQFNPTFEKKNSLASLGLHPELGSIFEGFELFRHQEEAILLGTSGEEFVVTSGTGSGKSLTYIATIFNYILNQDEAVKHRTQAVIVYPMNALINSQNEEIKKFERNYLKRKLPKGIELEKGNESLDEQIKELVTIVGDIFPIKYGQYTGQEDEETRKKMRENPPHIILTNYMMLELIMTRGGEDIELREKVLENIKYLVFDELHTYRGRQGSDVSMLIRRIKAAAQYSITCIGTSATMVSSDTTTLWEQKEEVAKIASLIFGTEIPAAQIVNEYLVRSLGNHVSINDDIVKAISETIDTEWDATIFENYPTANWLEENIALEKREDIWVRRKPLTVRAISEQLAAYTGENKETCEAHLQSLLEWANKLNAVTDKRKTYLPYRIHQFIAQTGSVYATLGNQESRKLYLDAGLYGENKDIYIFPIVFGRASGHEYYCVSLDEKKQTIMPREFTDMLNEEEDEEDNTSSFGYIFIQHKEDSEEIWDEERDKEYFPDSWFNPPKKDGTRSIMAKKRKRMPRKIYFDETGNYSFHEKKEFDAWFMTCPLLFEPTSGTLYDSKTAEWTKLMSLGVEGRSTATTVLSFETITQLQAFGLDNAKQKLLSFTDNRQDASLQAGHFNDFIKSGQLRAAIVKALNEYKHLDYTNIAGYVFESLRIPQEQFAAKTSNFPGPKKENEDAFKDFIMYRLLHDLRRSWRVVLPNLEQCALLSIEYKYLDESVIDNSLWAKNDLLRQMSSAERKVFLLQIFDFFRKCYALHYSMLESNTLEQNVKRIREKLKAPWTLDENERIELPLHIKIETLARTSQSIYTESAGPQTAFGRYLKQTAKEYSIEIRGKEGYKNFVYDLFKMLDDAGYLVSKKVKSEEGKEIPIYQLKVDNIIWEKGDGETLRPDLIKNRSYGNAKSRPNIYFKRFYETDFLHLKPLEGREHTGQINAQKRKDREAEFREGKIGALFCSPTMELGIDISDLAIVHLRNVPPSPANYAQRSGRAGRSGQAAMVMTYCSNRSAHDRHYFKHPEKMVSGTVTAPRMDLINEELLKSHLHASILTQYSINGLKNSLGEIVDTSDIDSLPLKSEVLAALSLSQEAKITICKSFQKVIEDTYFQRELVSKKPAWFSENWIMRCINDYPLTFDNALKRWRILYKNAILQFRASNEIIENYIYAENHDKINEAKKLRRQAEGQKFLLLNDDLKYKQNSQSEFYPFRYLAAEGFLPGYNFTRLPIRTLLENNNESGEFISRPRNIALSEFGPRNVIYHDGLKYRIDRMMLTEAEAKQESAKISPHSGYIMMKEQFNYNVDPIVGKELNQGMDKYIHNNMVEMTETKAIQLQRITCQEEERTKKGYDIQTFFSVEGSFESIAKALVMLDGEKLLSIHSMPAARLVHINFKWRNSNEDGYALNIRNGYWQSKKQEEDANDKGENESIKRIKLFTSTTANALYIQPVKSLMIEGGNDGVITLTYALKRAIETYFQVEGNEIGAEIMGEGEISNILIYEAAEGSLGILSQIVENPQIYQAVMKEAFDACFLNKNGEEIAKEELVPATYDDLLSYYNQRHHSVINRNLIREALRLLKSAKIEVNTNSSFNSYKEQYQFLEATRDPNSSTEEKFLQYLYQNGLKLPDEAQPNIPKMYVQPDFLYKPNICIFCDGTPHDTDRVQEDDTQKRKALKNAGYQVLVWYYKDSLADFVAKRPDIFKPIK